MKYITKKIAQWEIDYGQISIVGEDYPKAKKLFESYLDSTFELETPLRVFPNRHFIDPGNRLRLACGPFFTKLSDGEVIYIAPSSPGRIKISKKEPDKRAEAHLGEVGEQLARLGAPVDTVNILTKYMAENKELRDQIKDLFQYKDRIDKLHNLDYIFEDEKSMEDWLVHNMHKAIPSLEVIDRQPVITWGETFMRDRPDLFCLDKTTRELVIVENKVRGRHRKVDTQYLKYRTWVKRNLEKINEKYKERDLVATPNFKFVIITDTSDTRLEQICEDNGIGLVIIAGGVIFDELVPYRPNQ